MFYFLNIRRALKFRFSTFLLSQPSHHYLIYSKLLPYEVDFYEIVEIFFHTYIRKCTETYIPPYHCAYFEKKMNHNILCLTTNFLKNLRQNNIFIILGDHYGQ